MQTIEEQLVDAARRGDQGALGELLEGYQHRLYAVVLRMVGNADDALEVSQQAMLRIVEHIGDFQGKSKFSTWAIRIAMNLAISHLRKAKVRKAVSLEADGSGSGGGDQASSLRKQLADDREPGPAQSVETKEMVEYLYKALSIVEDDFRAVLVLRDIDQMDYAQIAATLSIPVGTVKSRLFRARLALRQEMLKLCPQQVAVKGGRNE